MANETPAAATPAADAPETAALLLATFAELYRLEIGAEEDVHRTLPFFGTALGVVVTALAFAAGRLPRWPDITSREGRPFFCIASGFLGLTIITALCVLALLAMAIRSRDYQRIGPETALQIRLAELQAYYDDPALSEAGKDQKLVNDMRLDLLDSYTDVTPPNRQLNRHRYKLRANASVLLVLSLNWVLAATVLTYVADKLGYFPRVIL